MLSQHTNLNTNYVTKHKGLPKKGCSVDFSEKGKNRLLSQPIKHLAYLNLSSPTLLIIHLCQYTRKFNMEFVFFFLSRPGCAVWQNYVVYIQKSIFFLALPFSKQTMPFLNHKLAELSLGSFYKKIVRG